MWRPDLEDYLATARVVLGLPYEQLRRLPGLPLAESALTAPFAGFAGQEAYPALEQKAAVLLERLVRTTRSRTGTSAPPSCSCSCSWSETAATGASRT